jgi:two-component system chemotaxis sensor kinase CheA
MLAIPLSQVTRLEKLPQNQIERAGDRLLIQYRGSIMQLLDVPKTLTGGTHQCMSIQHEHGSEEDETLLDVVVYTVRQKSVGLVVGQISDIVDLDLTVQGKPSREGVMCTVPLEDRVVEVLDINKVIKLADPGFFNKSN